MNAVEPHSPHTGRKGEYPVARARFRPSLYLVLTGSLLLRTVRRPRQGPHTHTHT